MNFPQLSDADNLQLRAWRRGELDADSTRAFETRLFFEPALLDAAQLDQTLAAGIAAQPGTAEPVVDASRRLPPWSLLLAAGLGAAAVLPLALPGGSPGVHANVEFVSVDVRRGSVDLLQVTPQTTTGMLAMRLPVPEDMRGPVAARLVPLDGGGAVLRVDNLRPQHGMVTLGFAPEAVAAGDYRVELRDARDDGWRDSGLALSYQPPRG